MKLAVLFWAPLLIAGTTIRENQMVAPGGGPGGLANGTLVITPSAPFTTPAGSRVEVIAREFPVRSGKVTIVLEPNDLGIPDNTRYLVTYKLLGGAERRAVWIVPTTASVLGIKDVEKVTLSAPAPGVPAGGAARYATTFVNATTVTVLGVVHQLGTRDLAVTCYDVAVPPHMVETDGWTVDAGTFDVTIRFAVPQSGRCVLQ